MEKTIRMLLNEEREFIAKDIEKNCPLYDIKEAIEKYSNGCNCEYHRLAKQILERIQTSPHS